MNKLVKIGCYGVGTIFVLAGGSYLFRNQIIAAAIETVVPKVTQTAVTVGAVDFNPFDGQAAIKSLTLGNPVGFDGDMLKIADISIKLEPKTVLSDKIVIHDIFINGVSANYAVSSYGLSNISLLQQNIEGEKKPEAAVKTDAAKQTAVPNEAKPGKKIVIDSFTLKNAEVSASFAGIGATMPLPNIHITDIGKKESTSVKEALADILSVFSKETLTALQGSAAEALKSGTKSLNKLMKKIF
ncbi:MAG TPA: hypothetical protein DD624_04415 [Alphaproteobacteria bacterium]|nr:hypothetical protein [Alphaproteobacteria bacterium]